MLSTGLVARNMGVGRHCAVWLVGLGIVATLSLVAGEGWADDWAVDSGDERQRQIVERYQSMLEDNPVEGMALERLLGHVGRGEGLDRLIDEYKARVDDQPDAFNLRLVLGHLLKARGDDEEAFEHYDRAVELDEDHALGWLSRGTVRLTMGQRTEAMDDFEQALKREDDGNRRREILQDLAELSFSEREFDRGIQFFDRLIDDSPRDQYLRMEYASLLVQYRQFDEAIEQYRKLRRLVAGDPRQKATLLRDKADVYEMKGDYDAAIDTYEEVKDLVRGGSWLAREVRHRIVDTYRQSGQLEEFLADYGRRWRRGDNEQRMLVADVHGELGMLEEALEQYRELARRAPRSVESLEKAIRVLERLGREDELPDAYRDLMQAAPDDEQYALELAEHYMQIGDRSGAREVLESAEQRFARQSYALLSIADYYARWNFYERATNAYRTVLEREPDDDAVIIDVGDYYFDRGDRQRAIDVWNQLPDSRLGPTEGSRRKAEVLVERGVMSEGIAAFERLLDEKPEDQRLLRAMARALERARQWDDALERWYQLLEVTDDPGRQREARSRIVELYERDQRLRSKIGTWSDQLEAPATDDVDAVDIGFFLAEAHLQLRQLDEAERVLRSLDEERSISDDERTSLLMTLERIYLRAERYDEAMDVLESLAEHDPAMRDELLERKTSYALEAGSDDSAVEYALRAVDANPNDASAHHQMGDVYRDIGDLEAAVRHYRTAVDIDDRAHDVILELGRALRKLGSVSEAEDALTTVVEEATETQLVRDAGEMMLELAEDEDRLDALEVQWTPLMFRMPIREAHARLMFDLYDRLVGPLLMDVYHGSPDRRGQARQRLYDLGGRAAPLLVDQLQRDSTAARIRGLRMVAEMEVDLAVPQVGRLIGDDDERLRAMAIAASARLGERRLVDPLEDALEDGSATVRNLAIWALGFIDDDRARSLLRQGADAEVQGTDTQLAILGLWGDPKPASTQVVAEQLEQVADGPAGVDRDRVAPLLAVATTSVVDGHGEVFRSVVEEMADTAHGKHGRWAARTLGGFGDQDASAYLWAMVLSGDSRLARRGERGLVEMEVAGDVADRNWNDEMRHFDWAEGEFDADGVIRQAVRRWTHGDREVSGESWSEVVEQGLVRACADGDGIEFRPSLARIVEAVDDSSPSGLWNEYTVQRLGRVVAESPVFDELDESTRMALSMLGGDDDGAVETETLAELDDDELMEVLSAMSAVGEPHHGESARRLWAEALDRTSPSLRQKAIRGIGTRGPEQTGGDERWARRILDALDDDSLAVQLAAVDAVGQLRLSEATDALDELEKEAPPALRRAVRQTRRVLEQSN